MGINLVKGLFENNAVKFSHSMAVVADDQSLDYQALNQQANQVAHALINQGIGENDRVGVCIERSSSLIVAILAIVKSGATYVPIDDKSPHDRITYIVGNAAPKLVLTSQDSQALIGDSCKTALISDLLADASLSTANPDMVLSPDAIAYIIYTSGTTGTPNGVQVSHHNLARLLSATDADFGFNENDTWTLFHSIGFDFSVWEMWGALAFGGKLVVVPYWTCREPNKFRELLIKEQVTVLNQTPSAFKSLINLIDSGEPMPTTLKNVIFGGERLEKAALRTWVDKFGINQPRLINMYGITETTVHVTFHELGFGDFFNDRDVIGKPIGDLQIHLFNEQLEAVEAGEIGEMYIQGEGVTHGYFGNAELSNQRFIEKAGKRLYKTGDLAKLNSEGLYEYHGRCDLQVKLRGFRIELNEIEAHLIRSEQINNVCVDVASAGINGDDDKQLVAFVETTGDIDFNALKAKLRGFLPEYMIPASFAPVAAIPLNNNGKADRKLLLSQLADGSLITPVSASAPIETAAVVSNNSNQMLDIFRSALNNDSITVEHNFLDVGGNSLLAVKVLNEIETAFGQSVSMLSLFENTIAQISAELGLEASVEAEPIKVSLTESLKNQPADQQIHVNVAGDEITTQFVTLVGKILNLENPDLSQGFLDLGGNSLVAVKMLAEIEQQFGQQVSMLTLFEDDLIDIVAQLGGSVQTESGSVDSIAPLLSIFSTAVANPAVTVADNFLDVGGNSLVAVKVLNEIQQQFGQSVSMLSLFENTIEQIAAELNLSAAATTATASVADDALTRLTQVFVDTLGVSELKPADNFLDLGGNSLVAVKLLAGFEQEFGFSLSMLSLFEHSVAQISSDIQQSQQN